MHVRGNLSLRKLSSSIGAAAEGAEVYAYVATSIALQDGELVQTGCGPNFAGDCITLCTCMHQMRAYKTPEQWQRGIYWIAGFTSRTREYGGCNWLVYLMKVGEAYASHYDLVEAFRRNGRTATLEAKFAHLHRRGDVFKPLEISSSRRDQRFVAARYRPPIKEHRHENGYEHDIDYFWQGLRRPALLVGDVHQSYRWPWPTIRKSSKVQLPRGNPKYSLASFVDALET